MDFDKILEKILTRLNEYQVRGEFKFDINNLENIDKVDTIIEDVLKEEGYFDNLKEYKKEFEANLKQTIIEYKSFGATATPDLKAFNELAFKNFYDKMLIVTETNIKQPIKDALLQHIAGGGKYKDFKNTVKEILETRKIEGNVDIVAREITTQYKRSQGQILANKYNVKYFKFFGKDIETSRCFCQQRANKIYSKEEIESWADLDWKGKIKGTNRTNIFQVLGGWNCRHDLIAVPEKIALAQGVNEYHDVECEL